jgi:uncharacterized membrane protein YedE/YeeE
MNKSNLTTYLLGVLFSIGLCLSGMTQPTKVTGFLDFTGNWDPSLLMVMLGAVSVYFTLSRFTLRRQAPVLAGKFALPTRVDIDGRLVAGAALFGTGWGLVGFCPGPALASLVTLNPSVWIFVVSMTMGMYVYGTLDTRFKNEPDSGAGALEPSAISLRLDRRAADRR